MVPSLTNPAEIPILTAPRRPGFSREMDQIKSPPPSGGGAITLPFTVKDTSPDTSTPTINVIYGTVMDLPPTDIATDIALTDDATNTIYLDNTLDSAGNVTASAVMVTTGSLPASSGFSAILLIGVAVAASGVIASISQSLYFSQGFSCCGRDSADPDTTPGVYEFFVR